MVLYLTWLHEIFPDKILLLVVDRSSTHDGSLVTAWLRENHSSSGRCRIYLEYISAGMTAVQQVPFLVINKPVKSHIKKSFCSFRYESLASSTANDLRGSLLTVPRECLVTMIDNAIDTINAENMRRRWIAHAYLKWQGEIPGQTPICGLKHI